MNYSYSSECLTNQSSVASVTTECCKLTTNMAELQGQIINQGKEIENFISIHEKKQGKSKSFIALQTLFKSFKAELSLNITLRQTLIEERENYKKNIRTLTKEVKAQNEFFEAISDYYKCDFSSFDEIFSKIKSSTKEAKNAQMYVKHIKQITKENQESEAQLSLDMAHLQACLEKLEEEKNQMQTKLNLSQCTINSKDQTIFTLKEQLKEMQIKQAATEQKLKESEEKRLQCEDLLKKAEYTLKSATTKAKQYRNERNKLSGYLQALDMIDTRQKELLDLIHERRACIGIPEPIQAPIPVARYRFDDSDSDEMFKCVKSLQGDINDLKQDIANFRE